MNARHKRTAGRGGLMQCIDAGCHALSSYSSRSVIENQMGRPVLFSASRIAVYLLKTRRGKKKDGVTCHIFESACPHTECDGVYGWFSCTD